MSKGRRALVRRIPDLKKVPKKNFRRHPSERYHRSNLISKKKDEKLGQSEENNNRSRRRFYSIRRIRVTSVKYMFGKIPFNSSYFAAPPSNRCPKSLVYTLREGATRRTPRRRTHFGASRAERNASPGVFIGFQIWHALSKGRRPIATRNP